MVHQLDVVCGDVSIDLSEDVLFGEAGLVKSLSASKTPRKLDEVHGISVAESSIPERVHPSPMLETDATAAAGAEASESGHISAPLQSDAAAVSTAAISEPPKGRVVKVPEKVCFHQVTSIHPSLLCNVFKDILLRISLSSSNRGLVR